MQAAKRNFPRRTKATGPPDTTETAIPSDNTETTTNNVTLRRGNNKFKPRKELGSEKNQIENRTRQPSLNGGARRSERPVVTRKFVRRRPGGGANGSTTSTTASPVGSSSSSSLSTTATRRPFRIPPRRKPAPKSTTTTTTTTTTTPAPTTTISGITTSVYEDEESLQDIGDIDGIEDPSLEPRTPKTNSKVQRRPLVSLTETANDQNPSATNEEEQKRQSKKYSASIKQNQLEGLLKEKSKSEEETTEKKTTDEYTGETALAIAAHQLITAPVPSIPDIEEDNSTKKTQTTVEYKYTSREYNEYTDAKTPTYEAFQTTPVYRNTQRQNYDQTTAFRIPNDFDLPKITTIDFEIPRSSPTRFATTPTYRTLSDYATTSAETYTSDFDRPKISTTTYNVPQSYLTNFPTTNEEYRTTTGNDYSIEFESPKETYVPKSPTTYPNTLTQEYVKTTENVYTETPIEYNSRIPTSFNTRPPTNYPTNTDIFARTTGNSYTETVTDYPTELSSSYVPKFPSTPEYVKTTQDTDKTEINTARISTTYPSRSRTKYFETTLDVETPTEFNSRISSTTIVPRSTIASRGRSRFEGKGLKDESTPNVIPAGFSGVQRGTPRSRGEKLIPVSIDEVYSTVGYSISQEPSYFTREYLLESPVTKTYDDEYQYLSPITSPQTPEPTTTTTTTTTTTPTPRKVFRKKIQRKISTTQRPTTRPPVPTTPAPTTTPLPTTVKPRRIPSKKPFEKVKPQPSRTYRPIDNYDYYDDGQEKLAGKYAQGTKVVLHSKGNIECLDVGNFPHPTSCKKFISCARMENGGFLGWEYVCPKGLSFDPVGGICNWSAGLGCDEKDA